MTTNGKITNGPNAFDMAINVFHPIEGELIQFTLDEGSDIHVTIDCARRLNAGGHDFELELFMPFPQGYRFMVHYNCHTRKGEVLSCVKEDNSWIADDENVPGPDDVEHWGGLAVDHELERAEHAMAHGAHRR